MCESTSCAHHSSSHMFVQVWLFILMGGPPPQFPVAQGTRIQSCGKTGFRAIGVQLLVIAVFWSLQVYLPTVGAPKEPIFKMDGNGETPGIWSHPIQKWLLQGTRKQVCEAMTSKKKLTFLHAIWTKAVDVCIVKMRTNHESQKHLSTRVLYILAPPNGLMEKLQIHLYCAVL